MRATQATTYRSLQTFMARTGDQMSKLQLQVATGKRLTRGSDDPTAIRPVLNARTQIQSSDRYIETIESGLDRVEHMDGLLDGMENTLVRIKEISIAAVNGSLNTQDMLTYADEVAQLKAALLDTGNAQVDGKFVFSGFAEATKPFAAADPALPISSTNPVVYAGDNGAVEYEIAPNELIKVNLTGNQFMLGDADNDGTTDPGAVDIFALVTSLEEELRANNPAGVGALIDPLESGANQVRSQRSIKGVVGRRLEVARDHMEQIKVDMEELRARYEDADILEAITSLQQQEQSFQAALSVTGRVSALSILDYI